MKKLLAILMFLSIVAHAEIREKTITVKCGDKKEFRSMIRAFKETPVVMATNEPDNVILIVWANKETQTSTWIAHLPSTGEYCTFGSGLTLRLPKTSQMVNYQ
jgi:hypothetical protein